jgi:hypothetical protein
MTISVGEVSAVPELDLALIRSTLRDAEPALLTCVDADGSTGVVAMKLAVAEDGFVRNIALRERTTYGSDDARACLMRILAAMRFSALGARSADVEIALEVSTRFSGR